jgi:hypothetical protein
VVKLNPFGGVMKTDTGSIADAALPEEKELLSANTSAKNMMVSPSDASILKTVMGRPLVVIPEVLESNTSKVPDRPVKKESVATFISKNTDASASPTALTVVPVVTKAIWKVPVPDDPLSTLRLSRKVALASAPPSPAMEEAASRVPNAADAEAFPVPPEFTRRDIALVIVGQFGEQGGESVVFAFGMETEVWTPVTESGHAWTDALRMSAQASQTQFFFIAVFLLCPE